MREIKFRAWEPLNKDMIYFDGFIPFQISERYIEGALNSKNQEKRYLTIMNFDAIEIMEYSGLKDNKRTKEYPEGQEIYEDDICKYSYMNPLNNQQIYYMWIVKYENGMWWLREITGKQYYDASLFLKFNQIEVIGNIYENPELLV